jgi:hypothetical protein
MHAAIPAALRLMRLCGAQLSAREPSRQLRRPEHVAPSAVAALVHLCRAASSSSRPGAGGLDDGAARHDFPARRPVTRAEETAARPCAAVDAPSHPLPAHIATPSIVFPPRAFPVKSARSAAAKRSDDGEGCADAQIPIVTNTGSVVCSSHSGVLPRWA